MMNKLVLSGWVAIMILMASSLSFAEENAGSYGYKMQNPYANKGQMSNLPSIPGPTGLVMNPSAYVLDRGDYDVSVDIVGWQDYVKVNVGLPYGLEAGLSFIERAQEEGALNLKWNFVPEADEHPAVSVGLFDIGSSSERTKYAVVSKNFTSMKTFRSKYRIDNLALRYHLGYKDTSIDESIFYGLEARLLVSKTSAFRKTLMKTTFMEEFDGDHFNFGMRYELTQATHLNFGILSVDDISVGISYRKNL